MWLVGVLLSLKYEGHSNTLLLHASQKIAMLCTLKTCHEISSPNAKDDMALLFFCHFRNFTSARRSLKDATCIHNLYKSDYELLHSKMTALSHKN